MQYIQNNQNYNIYFGMKYSQKLEMILMIYY